MVLSCGSVENHCLVFCTSGTWEYRVKTAARIHSPLTLILQNPIKVGICKKNKYSKPEQNLGFSIFFVQTVFQKWKQVSALCFPYICGIYASYLCYSIHTHTFMSMYTVSHCNWSCTAYFQDPAHDSRLRNWIVLVFSDPDDWNTVNHSVLWHKRNLFCSLSTSWTFSPTPMSWCLQYFSHQDHWKLKLSNF